MSSIRPDPSHRPGVPRGSLPRGAETTPGSTPEPRDAFLSIIVPARNEAASLPDLVAQVTHAFRPLIGRSTGNRLDGFELIIIDDGSTDDSAQVLQQLTLAYPELRPLRFACNYGQSAATSAGFHHARGAWVAILDADLQNPPSELARAWDALPGHDAVLGWRIKREDVWSKRLISRAANRVRHWVLGDSVKDTGCAVRIFPRATALRFPMFHGAHRFYGPLLLRDGCHIAQIPVEHRPRVHGRSNYNLWNRSLNVMIDLLGVAWLMRRPVRYHVAESLLPTDTRPAASTRTASPSRAEA
jgi:glycosyltransferase involved in cell wall biosynthesis